jgi:DNA gyrase subunit A
MNEDSIIEQGFEDIMRESMLPYAEHVILERALPRAEDGLKPVQRRILFTMQELGVEPDKPHRKSVRIVGDCLGKFHPHGDSSVYDAMVRLAQPFAMREALVDGHGNFGSIDADSAAAMRYTEARLTTLAMEMLRDIDKDTVPMRLNFDDTLKEPEVLPASYPNLLVNGSSGIAVGLATNIPPHNLAESVNAVVMRLTNPKCTLDDVMKVLPAPDFPTGGLLARDDSIRSAYETGRGKLTLLAKTHIEDGPSGRKLIVITQMPYQVAKSGMLARILKVSEEKRGIFQTIHDIRDESDREGIRAVIELKKEADAEEVLAALRRYTDLRVTVSVNIFVIYNGKPRQMGLLEILDSYIQHRKNVVRRRSQYDLDKASARRHILEGLIRAIDVLDEIIALIRASKDGKQAKERLVARFSFTEVQAQAILDLRLQRLTGLQILELREELDKLTKEIAGLEAILNSEAKLVRTIQAELLEIAKRFNDKRRTQLIDPIVSVIAPKAAVQAELTCVTLTRGGTLRRAASASKKAAVPPDGAVPSELTQETAELPEDGSLLFFTNFGNAIRLPVSSVPELLKPRDKAQPLRALTPNLEPNEIPIRMIAEPAQISGDESRLVFVTSRGMVKASKLCEYVVRKGKYQAVKLKDGDSLLSVSEYDKAASLLLVSRAGMAIMFNMAEVEPQGRVAAGVIGIRLEPNDTVVSAILSASCEGELILVSDRAFAKRVLISDVDAQKRGGKGGRVFAWNRNGSSGGMISAALSVRESYDFGIYTEQGLLARVSTEEIPIERVSGKGHALAVTMLPVSACVPIN